jgi:hypothetical protein
MPVVPLFMTLRNFLREREESLQMAGRGDRDMDRDSFEALENSTVVWKNVSAGYLAALEVGLAY